MLIPWDADIPIFVWAMARVIFRSKKRLREAQRAIPVHPEYEEIPENTLTQVQRDYILPFDIQLAALNYCPDCTYHTTNFRNYGHNLVRRYFNPMNSASCALTIVELKAKVDNVEAVRTTSSVAFTTRFSDGTLLTTRNMSLKSLMDRPPYITLQECRQVTNLAALKRRHEVRAARMGLALPPASGPKAIFEEQGHEHQRFSEFQQQCGIYRLLPGGELYEITDKAHVRGIWNHFNPFAKRISWPELTFSAAVGSVLPLFAILVFAPLLTERLRDFANPMVSFAMFALLMTVYALAGVIIGTVCDWAPFYWIMLISYLPAHLIAGWSFGWLPYSTTMFAFAFITRQAKRRRGLIFETKSHQG